MSEEKKHLNSLDLDLAESGDNVSNEQTTEYVEIPKSCWLDVTADIVEPTWLLRFNGVGFAPLRDIQVLRGMEGNGKSFCFAILMSAILRGEYGGITCDIPNARVLYVDTEQQANNTLLLQRRVHKICGWKGKEKNPRFEQLTLREVENLEDRLNYFWSAIEKFQPTAVFLDGVADLVSDINKYDECMQLVHKMMAEASRRNIAIFSILHVNYGSDKMRGHLGTEIAHKVSDVFSCQKRKEGADVIFEVEQVKARNKDVENFTFVINDDETRLGIPVITTMRDLDADTPTNRGERDELMKEIFQGGKYLSKTRVIEAIICKRFVVGSEAGKNHAKKWFDQAWQWGLIEEDSHKRQFYYVGIPDLAKPNATEQELPY